ncbi:hypothetical protein [Vibrio aphrogenes]|uniref:hypothetical protein n=1 Tax=Vibrio aphrogenes TaxID=1891186 RepID=UPI000B35A64A|nr:hypothetical protein [Vibrio aphrogenes]
MARLGMLIQTILAVSIFYLGYTIYHFTATVTTVVDKYPQLLNDISKTAETLKVDEWLMVANKFADVTPEALKTAQDINQTVDKVNTTVKAVNNTAENINQTIPKVLDEVQAVRTDVLPKVLAESAQLREAVPPMLAKVDSLMDKSEQLSKQAAQGAVKGVILSPIDLLKDAGTGIKNTVTHE